MDCPPKKKVVVRGWPLVEFRLYPHHTLYDWKLTLCYTNALRLCQEDYFAPLLYAANRLSHRFFQLLIWISYGKSKLAPTIQTSVNFRNSPVLNLRSLKTYHFQIWQFY